MGCFVYEVIVCDLEIGIIYEIEDCGEFGFYWFLLSELKNLSVGGLL